LEFNLFNETDAPIGLNVSAIAVVCSLIFKDNDHESTWLNVILQNTKDHTSLNINYLGHEYATDVITFDLSDSADICGEVYINLDVAKDNAHTHGVDTINEIQRLIIHGALHLAGYNDSSSEEKQLMKRKEDHYLNSFM